MFREVAVTANMIVPGAALRKDASRFVRFVLGDVFLGFLAIVAAALTIVPSIFKITPQLDAGLEAGQWTIIALFAVEYGKGLAAAGSQVKFILNPWRIIDAATIVIPLATLV